MNSLKSNESESFKEESSVTSDAGIVYYSEISNIRRMLESISDVGVNCDKYYKALENLEHDTEEEVQKNSEDVFGNTSLDIIYKNASANLARLELELRSYDSYIQGYHYAQYLESKFFGETLREDELEEYAKTIMKYIRGVHKSKTRDYNSVSSMLEKIYSIAYQIMKQEFVVLGKSTIFDEASKEPYISSFMSNEIAKDIVKIQEQGKDSLFLKQTLNRIRGNGLDASLLDKSLITTIALEDDNSIASRIRHQLEELLALAKSNAAEMGEDVRIIKGYASRIKKEKEDISKHRKENVIEFSKRTGLISIACSLCLGAYSLSSLLFKKEVYKSYVDKYSTLTGYSHYEGYEPKIDDDYEGIQLSELSPYKNRGNNYDRSKTVYNLSNLEDAAKKLEDYLSVNLNQAASEENSNETKNRADMSEDDFYDKTLYEVVHMIQDPEDHHTETEVAPLVFLSVLLSGMFNGLYAFILFEGIEYESEGFWDNKDNKNNIKKYLVEIKRKMEAYKRLADNNQELKAQFKELFDRYSEMQHSGQLKAQMKQLQEAIEIEDPQIELDKRTKKLVGAFSKQASGF